MVAGVKGGKSKNTVLQEREREGYGVVRKSEERYKFDFARKNEHKEKNIQRW